MNFERLEPLSGVARLKIADVVYFRLVDLAREYDVKQGVKGLGQQLAKMFREKNQNEFFYAELNPKYPRGYYVSEELVNRFVHFAGANVHVAIDAMSKKPDGGTVYKKAVAKKPKAIKVKKAKKRAPLSIIEATEKRFQVTQVDGARIGYFIEKGELWLRLSDLAQILRPDTALFRVFGNNVRSAGLEVRSYRYPGTNQRGAYFGRFSDWNNFLMMLHMDERNKIAIRAYDKLAKIIDGAGTAIPTDIQDQLSKLETIMESIRKNFGSAA